MDQINVQEAKTHLSRLLARVERGETIVLARGGRPIARIEPIAPAGQRELGFIELDVTGAFFEPLPDDELLAWNR